MNLATSFLQAVCLQHTYDLTLHKGLALQTKQREHTSLNDEFHVSTKYWDQRLEKTIIAESFTSVSCGLLHRRMATWNALLDADVPKNIHGSLILSPKC